MGKKNGQNGNGNGAKLELAVNFGSVSIGDETAHISVSCPRERLGIAMADQFLCAKRVGVSLKLGPSGTSGDDPGQGQFEGMDDAFADLSASADTGNVGFSRKKVGFGLTFALDEIGTAELGAFAKREGWLKIHSAEPLPEKERKAKTHDDHEDVGPRPIDGQAALPLGIDSGADMPISTLVKFGLTQHECETLAKTIEGQAGGLTIAHLERFIKVDDWWHTKIKGFAEAKVGKLKDAWLAFRTKYPIPTAEDAERAERANAAYKDGCEAALASDGKKAPKNPHPDKSPESVAWARGYSETAEGPAGATKRNRAKAAKTTGPGPEDQLPTAFDKGSEEVKPR